MNSFVRDYYVQVTGDTLQVISAYKGQLWLVCKSSLVTYQQEGCLMRPWRYPDLGKPVAHGILLHHFSQGRGPDEARTLTLEWREPFYEAWLRSQPAEEVHLPDWLIDRWLVEQYVRREATRPTCWLERRYMTPCAN